MHEEKNCTPGQVEGGAHAVEAPNTDCHHSQPEFVVTSEVTDSKHEAILLQFTTVAQSSV